MAQNSVEYVFIITVHEQPRCLVDLVCNIRAMNENIANRIGFCLHLSKNFKYEDDIDHQMVDDLVNGELFPPNYNVYVNPNRYCTTWGSISLYIVDTLKYALEIFRNPRYFVLLASNCIQTMKNQLMFLDKHERQLPTNAINNSSNISHLPGTLLIPKGKTHPDYCLTIMFTYPYYTNHEYAEHKFIKGMWQKYGEDMEFTYGFHEGIAMSTPIAAELVRLWYSSYQDDIEQMIYDNARYGCTEEYVFSTFLSNQKKCYSKRGLVVRQQPYLDIVERPSHESTFVKYIHRKINDPIRVAMRKKYNYDNEVQSIISKYTSEKYNVQLRLIYKSTQAYTPGSNIIIDCPIYGNEPRIFYFRIKTTSTDDACLIQTGLMKPNNCLNIVTCGGTIGIITVPNEIACRSTVRINDGNFHHVLVMFCNGEVRIIIDQKHIYVCPLHNVMTLCPWSLQHKSWIDCYVGKLNPMYGSNFKYSATFNGELDNLSILSGKIIAKDNTDLIKQINNLQISLANMQSDMNEPNDANDANSEMKILATN